MPIKVKTIYTAGIARNIFPYKFMIFEDKGIFYARDESGEIKFSDTDARKVIQSAIDSLVDGGKIFIKAGVYIINSPIIVKQNLELFGEGKSTVLKMGDGKNIDILKTDPAKTTPDFGIVISDICLDGNRANNTSGYGVNFYCVHSQIRDSYFVEMPSFAIRLFGLGTGAQRSVKNQIIRNQFYYASAIFFDNYAAENLFAENIVRTFGISNGIDIILAAEDAPEQTICFNDISSSDRHGIHLKSGYHKLIGNYIDSSYYHGLYLEVTTAWINYLTILGNVFANNNRVGTTYNAIHFAGLATMRINRCNIIGNLFWSPDHYYCIGGEYGSLTNLILGNHFAAYTEGAVVAGLGTAKHNYGYVTENSGTASGTSPITIPQTTHLLDVEPTYINAVSKTSGYYVVSVSFDPTTKDITIEHSGGTTSIDVFWEARAW